MTQDQEKTSKFENRVILVSILTGFIGSIIIFLLKLPPVMVAIFLGTGIASLVYRFLGGTTGASMAMGTLKLSGSIAVLLGSAYFINGELEKQLTKDRPGKTLEKISFNPHRSNWIAIDKRSGVPVEVKVNETNEVLPKPSNTELRNNPLKLIQNGPKYYIAAEDDTTFVLGHLDKDNFNSSKLFNKFRNSENFVVTGRLKVNESQSLAPLPFTIKTTAYANEYSQFQILKGDGTEVFSGQIYRRRFIIENIQNKHYLIAVVEVNHQPKNQEDPNSIDPYAKFAIAEIGVSFE